MDASTARPAPSLADWAWAAAAAVALLPVTVVEVAKAVVAADIAWASLVVGCYLALHVLVGLRRRSTRGTLIAASALMLVLTVASLPGAPTVAVLLPSSLVYLVFVFTAAASEDRLADLLALVLGALGAALMTAVATAHGVLTETAVDPGPGPLIALAGFLLASIGAAWALGRYRRESRRKLAAQQLGRAQAAELALQRERELLAEERRGLGRELHDVIAHSVAVMVAQAEASRVLIGRDDERARQGVEQVVRSGRAAMGDLRGLLEALSAVSPGGEEAPREPSPGIESIEALVEHARAPGREVWLSVTGAPAEVRPGVGLAAYRVVQEALTNTMRHTLAPTSSRVRLDWGGELTVTIEDDGVATGAGAPGRGVRGMRERVEQSGGGFWAGPRSDASGWRVCARLPVNDRGDGR